MHRYIILGVHTHAIKYLLHVNPLPMKPLLHVHIGRPPDGVHEAFGSQGLGLQGSVQKKYGIYIAIDYGTLYVCVCVHVCLCTCYCMKAQ